MVAKVLFWSCLLLITYSYALYPLVLLVAARFSRASATPISIPDDAPDELLPRVTMLFAARTLGYRVLLYDGSFEDWSRRDLPVENPSVKKDD